jgi:hypothetical protein
LKTGWIEKAPSLHFTRAAPAGERSQKTETPGKAGGELQKEIREIAKEW